MRQTSNKKNNMEIGERFLSESFKFTYLDPFNDFRMKEMSLEIRKDTHNRRYDSDTALPNTHIRTPVDRSLSGVVSCR
jgi:hypothetical protein